MPDPTVNQYYTEDHEHLHAALRRFQSLKAGEPVKAVEAFQGFKAGLERHILWEERILFRWYDQQLGHLRNCLTASLRRDHGQILVYLDEISSKLAQGNLAGGDEEARLESLLRLHNQKEEQALYPAMDQILNDEQRAAVFVAMKKAE
ncbi:MAG: hemerythrin domain-containing protein [Limisphaerales bacterium]